MRLYAYDRKLERSRHSLASAPFALNSTENFDPIEVERPTCTGSHNEQPLQERGTEEYGTEKRLVNFATGDGIFTIGKTDHLS